MNDPYIIPGLKAAKLVCVSVGDTTKNSNKFYNLYQQDNSTFLARWGRIDGHISEQIYPMKDWQKTIDKKVNRKNNPYTDVTHLFADIKPGAKVDRFSRITDIEVRNLIVTLQSYATASVNENYNIGSVSVTAQMIIDAQEKIDYIAACLLKAVASPVDIKRINKLFLDLYHIIPRKMKNVALHLCDESAESPTAIFSSMLQHEQETLDVMSGQVALNNNSSEQKDLDERDILEFLGLAVRQANNDEVLHIKKLLGQNVKQFVRAYAVCNKATQSNFDVALAGKRNKEVQLLWHGSRNQNWFNIISTGLLIRPSCATHTGSMFGDGVYFASLARKSIGYTSLQGSYWASGKSKSAYLALFSVHVGSQMHIYKHSAECTKLNGKKLEERSYDSVFAHGGADLINDEFIVYNTNQCTISYIIEICDK